MSTPRRSQTCRGSVLVTVLCFSAVLAISFAGILGYLNYQGSLDRRSHYWSQALHLAEAGIEIGYEELIVRHPDANGFKSARGWTKISTGTYRKTTTLTNTLGRVVGSLTITVSGTGGASPQILSVGTCQPGHYGPSVSRAVKVIVSQGRQGYCFFCTDFMNLSGNKIFVDSYDSTDPTKSTGGLYDPAKAQPNADCGVLGGAFTISSSGGADIYGKVWTGPSGTFTMSSGGSVGNTFDAAQRAYDVPTGEALGYINHDLEGSLPDVVLPAALNSAPFLPNITSSTTITDGDYRVNSINLGAGDEVVFRGTVRIYVLGDVKIAGTASITVDANSSVEFYAAGNWTVSGKGVVNKNGAASRCRVNGLPTCTTMSYSGSSAMHAYVYAPQADVTLSGGSASYHGAIQARSITASGSVTFHYDESLFAVATKEIKSWQELRNVGGNWVP